MTERLYRDAEESRLLRERVKKEKELYEEREAIILANKRSDKHINEKTYRTVDQFMDDQIFYEQRKFENLKSVAEKKSLQDVHSYKPVTNPKSKKLVEGRRAQDTEEVQLYSHSNNGIARSEKSKQEYLASKDKELTLKPKINVLSKVAHRNLETIQEDTHIRWTKQQLHMEMMRKKEKVPGLQIGA